jgi:hypothetical protein
VVYQNLTHLHNMDKLQKTIDYLRDQGRFGDTDLVHVNPQEKAMLKAMGGAGTVNPSTGLEEYWGFRIGPIGIGSDYGGISVGNTSIGDVLSKIDDTVRDVVPGGWATIAAGTGLYFAPEIAAIGNAAESAALAEGATTAEAATAGLNAATTAQAAGTDYLGSMALGDASTGAIGSGTGFGLGTEVAGTGISAATPGVMGSNAASGLGYLGGMESLPAGTAGISGVTAPSALSAGDMYKAYNTLTGAGQQISRGLNPSYGVGEMYKMQNPFFFPKEEVATKQDKQTAKYLGQLANLLRG